MLRTGLLAALFTLVPTFAPIEGGEQAEALVVEARSLLEEEDADGALEKVVVTPEYELLDVDILAFASDVAFAAEDDDRGLWYASLAMAACADDEAGIARAELLRTSFLEGDPFEGKGLDLRDDFAQDLFDLGSVAARQKLYLNAVDLFRRCEGTALESKADQQLDRLLGNKKAVAAMLSTGIVVPGKVKRRKKSLEKIRREDKAHSTWEKAWEFKGKNYKLQTNLGQELAEELLQAMDQMNQFYRSVFHYKERGGGTATCAIKIYATRDEFDEHQPGVDQNVWGFFTPGVNSVTTFDPRSKGVPLSDLFSTLFHEASHQFTNIISSDLVPGWLNEGTASYFEGARILQNGVVETNLVPESRLEDLMFLLEEGTPTLKQVVSYHSPGSYDGEYYPFGWGLVYFMRNYEDEKSERVYIEPYEKFMASYKSGGQHETFERFVDIFIKQPKQPGVKTFEDFDERFTKWIMELGDLYFGPEDRADLLVERARKQLKNKQPEAAVESYRFALRKRPNDAVASFELAQIMAKDRLKDAAAFRFRQALAFTRSDKSQAKALHAVHGVPVEACMKGVKKVNRGFAEKISAAETKFISDSVETANAYAEVDLPLAGLQLLDTSLRMLGQEVSMSAARDAIVKEHEVETRRWHRLSFDEVEWERGEEWSVDGEQISISSDSPEFALHTGELPARYRFEADIVPSAVEPGMFVGLLFSSSNASGYRVLGLDSRGVIELCHVGKKWETLESWEDAFEPEMAAGFQFAVEVEEGKTTFFLDGKKLGEHSFTRSEQQGRIGIYAQDASVEFRVLRVR